MDQLKVGDKVRCVHPADRRLFEGAVYEIDYYGPGTHCKNHTFVGVAGSSARWNPGRFELAEPRRMEAHKAEYRAARANDPATSKGKRKVNKYEQAVMLALHEDAAIDPALDATPGMTGKEIALHAGHELNCITPRFAPLRRKGLIKALEAGGKVVKRDKQIVWVLA